MIAVQTHIDNVSTNKEMPNFVIWYWMRAGLHLSGTNLMLFAYIYSQSFDDTHHTVTSLTTLSEWFGISRQTLSRNIDKLPYVQKKVSQDGCSGFYTFVYYRVDMEGLLKNFICGDEEVYKDFLLSYQKLLVLKFPDDEKTIENYFDVLLKWHGGLNEDLLNRAESVLALGDLVDSNSSEDYNLTSFIEELNGIKLQIDKLSEVVLQLSNSNKKGVEPTISKTLLSEREQTQEKSDEDKSLSKVTEQTNDSTPTKRKTGRKPSDLGIVAKPTKKKSREEKEKERERFINETMNTMFAMNVDYITTHNITDERFLPALDAYVESVMNNPKVQGYFTPTKYKNLLRSLDKLISIEDRLCVIDRSALGSYTQFIYGSAVDVESLNRIETNKRRILDYTETFIKQFPDADSEFAEDIRRYVEDCVIGNWVPYSFENRMKQLLNANLSYTQVLEVIHSTTGNGWKAWNFDVLGSNTTSASPTSGVAIEMEEKEQAIDEFFRKHYFYQTPEIKELLLNYVHNCDNGRHVSAKDLTDKMEYLLQHRFLMADITSAIEDATTHNYPDLCLPDYEQEKKVKKSHGTLTHWVETSDMYRRKYCEQERRKNPNDPRFEGMGLDRQHEVMLRRYGRILTD